MNFEELLEKYQALLVENSNLKKEVKIISLTGGMGRKDTSKILSKISDTPADKH